MLVPFSTIYTRGYDIVNYMLKARKLSKSIVQFYKKPEGFFVFTALIFGGLFMLVVPPLQTPDEYTHLLRAYEVSEFSHPKEYPGTNGQKGSYMPASIGDTGDLINPVILFGNQSAKYDHHTTKAALVDIPLNQADKVFYKTASTPPYPPAVYYPSALAILIAKFFDMPFIVMIYLVRIINLSLWLALGFSIIRLFPWKKWAVAGLLLLPMLVAQSVSAGVDVIVVGSSLLFASIIFKAIAYKEPVSILKIGILILILSISALSKSIGLALAPLILLIPNRQFMNAKIAFFLKLLVVVVPVIAYLSWSAIAAGRESAATNLNISGQDSASQVDYLVDDPFNFTEALFNTYFFSAGDNVINSFIGYFGAYDTPLPATFIIIGYLLVAFSLFVNIDGDQIKHRLKKKRDLIIVGAVALIYAMGICLAMYIYASPVANEIIVGTQGRYFLIIPVLLIPLFLSLDIKTNKRFFVKVITSLTYVLLLASATTVMFRYYIP